MIFDSNNGTTIVFQENISLQKFLDNLKGGTQKLKMTVLLSIFFLLPN